MSTIKGDLKKNDFIAPKDNMSDVHFVIKTDLHEIVLRRESDDELMAIKIKNYNMGMWHKVDPETVKVLYAEMAEEAQDVNS